MSHENKRHFDEKTLKIQVLNDRFRRTFIGGQVFMTSGVSSLPQSELITLMNLVRTFNEFNGDNDPYGEHDFGKIDLNGTAYFGRLTITMLIWNVYLPTRRTKLLPVVF